MIPFLSKHCHISVPHHGKIRGIQNVQCTYKTYIRLKFVLLGEIFGCGLEKPRNFVVTSQRTNQSPLAHVFLPFSPQGEGGWLPLSYMFLPFPLPRLQIIMQSFPSPHWNWWFTAFSTPPPLSPSYVNLSSPMQPVITYKPSIVAPQTAWQRCQMIWFKRTLNNKNY